MRVVWLTVLMALVTFRVARFLVDDGLIVEWRISLHTRLLSSETAFARKLHELVTCYWCLTIWISAGVVASVDQFTSVPLPWLQWLAVAMLAMTVGQVSDPS